jgi:shikimate kinase
VVWLQADTETICRRLAGDQTTPSQRPTLSGQDIYAEVAEILAARSPLYAAGSHLALDATGRLEDIVDKIIRNFEQSR